MPTQPAGDGRAHLLTIEVFALDLARLDDNFREGLKHRYRPKIEAETLHTAQETPTPVTHRSQFMGDGIFIPMEAGSVFMLMNVLRHIACTTYGEYGA